MTRLSAKSERRQRLDGPFPLAAMDNLAQALRRGYRLARQRQLTRRALLDLQAAELKDIGLSAEQIAVLQEQGFELRDEGWEFGMSSKVLFGNNLDRLNPDSRNTLTKIAHALLAVDIDKVRLEGHTDNYGDEGYNQKLSERRAESVAAVFREAGMPAANIEVRGLGMSKPVADNKTRAGRSENRRVAIIVPAE